MNRRDLLKRGGLAAGLGLAGGLVSPADAEEVRARVKTASEPSALRITDLRVVPMLGAMGSHVVRLDTNQGIHGYGEIRDGASPTYALMLKSRVLGENPCHVDKIFRKLKQFGGHGRQAGGVVALEIACWDLAGKAWGVPCWQMLGGKFRDRVRIYADTTTSRDPQVMGQRLKERRQRGFTFLKMDVGIGLLRGVEGALTSPGQDFEPTPRRRAAPAPGGPLPSPGTRVTDLGLKKIQEYVLAVRQIVGWDIPLAADHFGRVGVEDAIKLAQALDPCNLAWLEDMIPWSQTDDYVRLKDACKTPILTGEDIYLKEEFLKLFQKRAISICQPDLMTAGGLLETKKIGDLALEYGVGMAMHMAGSPVGLLASVHCAAASENFLVLESHDMDNPFYDDLLDGVPKPLVKDGFVQVPDGPGLGIELNEKAVKDALRRRGRENDYFPPTDPWNSERSMDRPWS
ncbi:MAG: mandelate racemase/muconate lactonizing enzyme family protein [Pirellulales bacterium]